MNKLLIILSTLIVIMGLVWYFKSTIPAERNDSVTYNKGAGVWWDTTFEKPWFACKSKTTGTSYALAIAA